jgi:hypothetical protein
MYRPNNNKLTWGETASVLGDTFTGLVTPSGYGWTPEERDIKKKRKKKERGYFSKIYDIKKIKSLYDNGYELKPTNTPFIPRQIYYFFNPDNTNELLRMTCSTINGDGICNMTDPFGRNIQISKDYPVWSRKGSISNYLNKSYARAYGGPSSYTAIQHTANESAYNPPTITLSRYGGKTRKNKIIKIIRQQKSEKNQRKQKNQKNQRKQKITIKQRQKISMNKKSKKTKTKTKTRTQKKR